MEITDETIIFSKPSILYSPGHPKRPVNYNQTKVLENIIWIWNQIKDCFNPDDWYVLNLSPLKRFDNSELISALPHIINRASVAINPRVYRKGLKTRFYAALEHTDDTCYGDHLHCLVEVPGGLQEHQQRRLNSNLKSMQIFKGSSRSVNIRQLCPSGDFLDISKTLHYHCKQTNEHNDPYAYHKDNKTKFLLSQQVQKASARLGDY